jgi:copper chaperone
MIKTTLVIHGMMCTHCKASVEKALMAVPGTESVEVDLKGKTATVLSAASYDMLADAVVKAGFTVVRV